MSTMAAYGRQMGVTPLDGGNTGGGLGGGRYIHNEEAEQGRSVHFETTNY